MPKRKKSVDGVVGNAADAAKASSIFAALFFASLAASIAPANAEPRPRSKGFYAEAGIGGRGYLADAGESSAIGPNASLHLGIDLFSWFSVGGQLGASSHEATVPAPPVGEYYQLYSAAGEARLSIPVGPLAVFADGRAGLAMVSTNILEKSAILDPGERFTLMFGGGGGLEYQLQNRHYAFGVAGSYTLLPAYDASSSVSARFFLRYTY